MGPKEKSVRATLATGAVLALLMLSACGGGPTGPGASPSATVLLGGADTVFCGVFNEGTTIVIKDNIFTPADVTIAAGGEVDWDNQDDRTHVIKFDSGTTCGTVMGGQIKKVRFSAAGLFPYHCTIHDNMRGTITVTE